MDEMNMSGKQRPREEPESQFSDITNDSQTADSQDDGLPAPKRVRTSELPELNNALVVFANEMATVNDEIDREQANSGESQMEASDDETVTTIRSGASASIDNTIDSNASNASTEIEAFFAPRLPEATIDFERVGNLFTNLANAFTSAANTLASSVAPMAMNTATQMMTLPDPVRNQFVELSMAASMLGLSRYMPNINMNVPGVNTLLTSISNVSQVLSGYGLTASIAGIALITSIRSDLPANIIARIFTELTITEAGVYNVSFAAQESKDKAKIARATYNMLKQDYETSMEALISAIQNKLPTDEIDRLKQAVDTAKANVMSAIGSAKSGAGAGAGGKRQSQKKQKQQKKQQKKTQKQSQKKLSKSKRAKKAKQSKKANKKH